MSINDLLDSEIVIPAMLVFLLLFLVIGIPFGIGIGNAKRKILYGDKCCELCEESNTKIIAKIIRNHPTNSSIMINIVIFELKNGNKVELSIENQAKFNSMNEGDTGLLCYHGKRFISFKRGY